MALLNPDSRATEHFDFGASAADLQASATPRNIRNEVTNKGMDPEAVMDAFERSKGIMRPSKSADLAAYVFKNIIIDPEDQQGQDLLNELMNNKKYMITLWKDTWTNQGNYRVFIIYGTKPEKPDTEPK